MQSSRARCLKSGTDCDNAVRGDMSEGNISYTCSYYAAVLLDDDINLLFRHGSRDLCTQAVTCRVWPNTLPIGLYCRPRSRPRPMCDDLSSLLIMGTQNIIGLHYASEIIYNCIYCPEK